ncbi:hypothetical protein [Dysosmobacter sp.]|uniref:hypothetical protein n=1 Tax=Dysosmobacter sp. TaxID=2591382 RepID=UPI002A8FA1A7|nr:hypothetical protein [Dysosmobacter sp.]MDY3281638.1 hypothetical protein [Dysosmobacter sp.]
MTELLIQIRNALLMAAPILLLTFAVGCVNLRRRNRYRQFAMPVLALVFSIAAIVTLPRINGLVLLLLPDIGLLLAGTPLNAVAGWITLLLQSPSLSFWVMYLTNLVLLTVHLLCKMVLLPLMSLLFRKGCGPCELFYEQSQENGGWYLKTHLGQGRTYVKTFYITAVILSAVLIRVSRFLYAGGLLATPFYPCFPIILLGEVYFFLNGLTEAEQRSGGLAAEEEDSISAGNSAAMRQALRRLFGDKLAADNTTVSSAFSVAGKESLLDAMERSGDGKVEAYAAFMRGRISAGLEVNPNYLTSGMELLQGKNILFNNPFYYDLIPCAFYAMNRVLMRRRKVLIVLGRHGMEEEIDRWCRAGFGAVTNMPDLWKIGVLSRGKARPEKQEEEPEVGILPLSGVGDLELHEIQADFLSQVGFMVLIEPSRLIPTAQIGLHSVVRHLRAGEVTFCSVDKNCDGLVDALSHILMTDISEVSATNRHAGTCSYMCWETDREMLQHRMLPNVSHYLGVGTELSFVALKNQISAAYWYGGDAFPVSDMQWIARQYYYDLLSYASLPANQDLMNTCFRVSPNLYEAGVVKSRYMTVEDEAFNMFEAKRNFSTRTSEQSFINVISSEYLLRDYMSDNNSIFDADPKAIPYIVADYARTRRNVALRSFLRMCVGQVMESDLVNELSLIGEETDEPAAVLWGELCRCYQPSGALRRDDRGAEMLVRTIDGQEYAFTRETIRCCRRYNMARGIVENAYFVENRHLRRLLLGDLRNAGYIAEDENGERQFIGSELCGHIFQKYLPGQFFTIHGKYYEMMGMSTDGQILLRRAADHITGRPMYRQLRRYTLTHMTDSTEMGAVRDIGGLRLTRRFADIAVETDAYWLMDRYNDFKNARKVSVSGIRQRSYFRKSVLCVDFSGVDGFTREIAQTLTVLMNEIFRTLFAENQDYIAAVLPGDFDAPLTYSLRCGEGAALDSRCICIIEDSLLDIGLLVAVERNLQRILSIACDYLDWHFDALDRSRNPAEPEKVEVPAMEPPAVRKKTIRERIRDFFGRLFGRKKAAPAPEDTSGDDPSDPPAGDGAGAPPEEDAQASMSMALYEQTAAADAEADADQDSLSFEAPEARRPLPAMTRAPYHERFYLLYGQTEVPEMLALQETLEFLKGYGCDNGTLKQARLGKNIAEQIEKNFRPGRDGAHYCDFCGTELIGTEYDVLADGRERCTNCSRTAVRTAEEFRHIHREVVRNLETFYGIRIQVPVDIQMVNAKKLHKKLGKTFVPTGNSDGRILGVAIQDRRGNYTILMENGAPRMASIMTMVHEMTHIWQYTNWDRKAIRSQYGPAMELQVYEGMAKWSEIQYAYMTGETAAAKREEILTRMRKDEYGIGFLRYLAKYSISYDSHLRDDTPFKNPKAPL